MRTLLSLRNLSNRCRRFPAKAALPLWLFSNFRVRTLGTDQRMRQHLEVYEKKKLQIRIVERERERCNKINDKIIVDETLLNRMVFNTIPPTALRKFGIPNTKVRLPAGRRLQLSCFSPESNFERFVVV